MLALSRYYYNLLFLTLAINSVSRSSGILASDTRLTILKFCLYSQSLSSTSQLVFLL